LEIFDSDVSGEDDGAVDDVGNFFRFVTAVAAK
jgi:hypothetical protein